MKYRRPQWNNETAGQFYFDACMNFISDLPAEFETIPEGHVCVKWPDGLTREYLQELADYVGQGTPRIGTLSALIGLAAIAPERKKRRVSLWEVGGRIHVWGEHDTAGYPWRKVAGPVEIDD